MLPEVVEKVGFTTNVSLYFLLGIVIFFVLESKSLFGIDDFVQELQNIADKAFSFRAKTFTYKPERLFFKFVEHV